MSALRSLPSSLWAALLMACAFALLVPRFASIGNVENVLRVAAILALASAGQAVVLVIGGIEFAMGASVALVSVVTFMAVPHTSGPWVLLLGGSVAIAIGLVNGLLIARMRVNPLVATLGMSLIAAALASHLTGGMPLDPVPSNSFYWLGRGELAGIPVPIILAALGLLALHILLRHSVIGRRWSLVGINRAAAQHAGLHVVRITAAAYVVCGVFTCLAGMILTSRVASGQPHLYPALPFETIAACAVGGVSLAGGRASAMQVLCGVMIVAMLNNVVVLLNLPAAYQQLLIGLVIVVAVSAQQPTVLKFLLALRTAGPNPTEPVRGDVRTPS